MKENFYMPTWQFFDHLSREEDLTARRIWLVYLEEYMQAGCPFGASRRGVLLWLTFGQRTQVN